MAEVMRNLVQIDEDKCNGCGICILACSEGALQMIDGKAKLVSDEYCDGLGDCLPECPTGAITVVKQAARKFDFEKTVQALEKDGKTLEHDPRLKMEPGTYHGTPEIPAPAAAQAPSATDSAAAPARKSQLKQWPVQIKLAMENGDYFDGADLLIAADCTAYAYPNIHEDFMKGKVTLIGCPKLDAIEYQHKLQRIFELNNIKSVTVLRMEVPCCGGIEYAAKEALKGSGKMIPWQIVTLSLDGEILASSF